MSWHSMPHTNCSELSTQFSVLRKIDVIPTIGKTVFLLLRQMQICYCYCYCCIALDCVRIRCLPWRLWTVTLSSTDVWLRMAATMMTMTRCLRWSLKRKHIRHSCFLQKDTAYSSPQMNRKPSNTSSTKTIDETQLIPTQLALINNTTLLCCFDPFRNCVRKCFMMICFYADVTWMGMHWLASYICQIILIGSIPCGFHSFWS